MNYVYFICIMIPALLSLFVLEKPSRLVFGCFLTGISICLFTSEANDILFGLIGESTDYFTTTISPVTEEIAKAIPILAIAFLMNERSDHPGTKDLVQRKTDGSQALKTKAVDFRKKIVQASFAVGLGFAVMENITILTRVTPTDSVGVTWAFTRGLGAGLLHSVCTMAVGLGVSFVRTRKKFFYCGTLALLMLAVTYHAIYNTIITSPWKNFGFALPLATYIPILYLYIKKSSSNATTDMG